MIRSIQIRLQVITLDQLRIGVLQQDLLSGCSIITIVVVVESLQSLSFFNVSDSPFLVSLEILLLEQVLKMRLLLACLFDLL